MFDKLLEKIKRVDEIESKLLSIFEGKSWEYTARALYQTLDDIDTADDICKEDLQEFQNVVLELQAKKNKFLSSDGYNLKRVSEGFLYLAHEVPGIDKRGREILQVGYDNNLITDITNLPGDKEPDLETMASDLTFHLSELADFSKDVGKKKKLRQLADYFEEHENDKGVISGGYLQYVVIPLLIDGLKEEGLWDEQMNAPIFKLEKDVEEKIEENLTGHARRELELAGMFDAKVDGSEACGEWNKLCAEAVIELMEVFAEQGHSGFSASMTQDLFSRLAKYEPLTELTDNSDEWNDISEMQSGEPGWQSQRSPSCFSEDGGKTYWDINEEYYIREDEDGERYSGSLSEDEWKNRPMHQSKHIEKEE